MNAVDQCADALQASIIRGDHPAGARLPPERDLAAAFGVGRATVRSALGRLAARGLVEVRQGSGYAVQDFRRSGGMELLPQLAANADARGERDLAAELLRLRRHLAAALLERLSELEAPDLGPIIASVDRLEKLAQRGASTQALAQADLEVIATLLDASGSVPLQLCFNPLMKVAMAMPRLRAVIYAEPSTNVAAYRALIGWLAGPHDDPAALAALLATRDAANLSALGAAGQELR